MGTLGEYEYPDITISQAVDIVRVIDDKSIERLDVLANSIGHSGPTAWRGGAFRAKLAALPRYGLLEGKQNDLRLSELAKRILHPTSETDKNAALASAILSIPILAKVHEKLHGEVPSDFWVPLYDCTGVDRKLVKEHADDIRRLYADAVRYLGETPSPTPKAKAAIREEDEEMALDVDVPPSMMHFRSGAIRVNLPVSPQNVKVLIQLLNGLAEDNKATNG
jgi:hypothetical protein